MRIQIALMQQITNKTHNVSWSLRQLTFYLADTCFQRQTAVEIDQ